MPTFLYEALDAQGKEVKADIEALSNKEAISKIRNKGLFPLSQFTISKYGPVIIKELIRQLLGLFSYLTKFGKILRSVI